MKTKLTQEDKERLCKGLLAALMHHHSDDISDFCDSLDKAPHPVDGKEDTFILVLTKFVDEVIPGHHGRGPGGRKTIGTMTVQLEVKVTDFFKKHDEDE